MRMRSGANANGEQRKCCFVFGQGISRKVEGIRLQLK
jgi:hypothetical protein